MSALSTSQLDDRNLYMRYNSKLAQMMWFSSMVQEIVSLSPIGTIAIVKCECA